MTGRRPLIGRTDELHDLDVALGEASEGRPGAVVLGGEPGVGKSSVLAEFIRRARESGANVLRGGCLALGGGALPYLPLTDMLRGLVRARGAEHVRRLVDPAWPELARVLPALGHGMPPERAAADGSPGQLFEAVLRLAEGCADEAPTVLAVEDLHWIDRSTAELLVFLVRTFVDERVLVVGTCRSAEPPVVRALLSDLSASGRCRRRELRPLPPDAIRAMVRDLLGHEPDPALLDWVIERSDGNAFFARELVAAGMPSDGAVPVVVRDLVQARLDEVGPTARYVASAVASAGRPVAHRLVAAAAPLPTAELLRALRACVTAGLLVVDDAQQYTFRHALARDAVYTELLPGERAACHRALAEALAAEPLLALPDPAGAAAELAHHWDRADDAPRTLASSVVAGRAAAEVDGYAEAEQQYERALLLWPAVADRPAGLDLPELLTRAADAARWTGRVDRALSRVQRALGELDEAAPGSRVGVLHERSGRYLWELGRTDESLRAYEQARSAFAGEPASAEMAWALGGYATALVQVGRLREAVEECREAMRVAELAGATAEGGRAMNTWGAALTMLGSPSEGIDALREAVRIAQEGRNLEDVLRGYANLGYALETAGRLAESLEATLDGVRRSRELGLDTTGGAVLLANAASVLAMLGRWDEAEELAESAGGRLTPPGLDGYRQIVLAELDVGRGRFAAALDRLRGTGAGLRAEPQFAGPWHAISAEADLWQGRDGAALTTVARGLEAVAAGEDVAQVLRLCALGLRAAADGAARRRALGEPEPDDAATADGLHTCAEQAAGTAQLLPVPAAVKALCDAERARHQGADDPPLWAGVADRWAGLEQLYPTAYARWRQAEAAVRTGDREAAVGPLGEAARIAADLGAVPLRGEVEALARAARLDLDLPRSAPEEAVATPFGLTRREQQVVALLAEGATNRQIARQLFITEKTAGVHVSNILRKMQVPNRGQAAVVARRVGLVD